MSRSGLQGSQAGQARGLGLGPRSRPRSRALLTGRRRCPERGGPGFLRITSSAIHPSSCRRPQLGGPRLLGEMRVGEPRSPGPPDRPGRLLEDNDSLKAARWRPRLRGAAGTERVLTTSTGLSRLFWGWDRAGGPRISQLSGSERFLSPRDVSQGVRARFGQKPAFSF